MKGFSTLRERGEALREGIEELLLEESSRASTEHLKSAVASVSTFCELGATEAGLAALDALKTALERAKAAMTAGAGDGMLFDEALTWSKELRARALDELASASPLVARVDELPFGFRASKGSPAVHEARDVPPLDVLAKARAWDDPSPDDDEPAPRDPRLDSPLYASLARLGRDTMEDIAILGGLRRLDDQDRFADAEGFEERLLANLDLLWALDAPAHDDVPKLGVPRALFRYATEWSFPDWGRAFALAFGLGCSSSEAALRWVLLAMRRAPPASYDAYAKGLALGSNPFIDRTISAELRTEAPAELLAALLEVAERRGVFEASAVVPLLAHPAARVKIAALRALRNAPVELAVASALQLLGAADPMVQAEAADELARRGNADGLGHLRELLVRDASLPERTLALRAIALAGITKDETLVMEQARDREDGAVWLGFYGRPSVVPILLELIRQGRETPLEKATQLRHAERAFQRVTGLDASADVPVLRARFEESGMAKKAPRLRAGEAHAVQAVLAELLGANALQGERRILARELALLVPNAPPVDVDGFTARQLALLATIDPR